MLKVGMFIQNRYEIISKIGSGGMADVYKAKDHKLNRFVAVKVLKKEFRDDREFISKFRVEAQSAAGLAHANIVNIYDTGEEAGIYYIVMELVEGITLKEYIKMKGRLSVREATSIALQISAGLEAAHNNGIIHRDIKPQNIIISTDGKVKVADFGIARASSGNTINSSVMGSVHYSSPEQSRGGYSDQKSDIYSLGITMYEMLTGHVPFDGDTAVAVALKHLQEDLKGPKELIPEIPNSTNAIVLKCTQKSPDRRYANMAEVIRDLRESLVNPDGNFVTQQQPDDMSKTIVISKNDLQQINAEHQQSGTAPTTQQSERSMPSYDESLDVGAAAHIHGTGSAQNQQSRAYQPGSYYQKSGYQEVSPSGGEAHADRWGDDHTQDGEQESGYDPYYDAYDNPADYKIEDESFHLNRPSGGRHLHFKDRDPDKEVGLNPKLEKVVTVGGIIVAVVIGCVFLALVANAFGLFKFGKKNHTGTPVKQETESESESETNGKSVAVPEILGLSEADAQKLLKSYGLTGEKKGEKDSDKYTAGQVCTQSPEKGEMVARGTAVAYDLVPEGDELVLDDLTNIEQSQAQAFLLTKGLKCEVDNSRTSDSVEMGHVISTTPAAGAKVKAGDTVVLYVSAGAQSETDPVDYVQLWSLTGYTKDRATEALEMLELVPNYEYQPSSDVAEGLVISQSADPNTDIARGSTVTLVISSGPNGEDTTTSSDPITTDNGDGTVWKCNASLNEPEGYSGQNVRITLVQDGSGESTIFEGQTSFPYKLQIQGASGVTSGTAYIYLLDSSGNVTSKIEYPGIVFSQVNS